MTDSSPASPEPTPRPPRARYVPVVGPRLRRVLAVIFALVAVMVVNSVYLVSITLAGVAYQNWFYLWMFLLHLILGLAIVVPVIVFGVIHIRNARNRPNRRAIRAGYALFAAAIALFVTGFVLTRVDIGGFRLELNQPLLRSAAYWVHVLAPVAAAWLFVLHRLAGRRLRWRTGLAWGAVAIVFAGIALLFQVQDPRAWNVAGSPLGEQYFAPALSRTSTGGFIPERTLRNDAYCLECHTDHHERWSHSAHRFSSFNNPAYEFSVKATRRVLMDRDGDVHASRFCAGCHDPVPFFSGAFDDPRFDDPEYDLSSDRLAQAGITCTSCHAISHVNSVRGNGDFTITEPVHYPFTFSENPALRWINRQLVKAKPAFHKATFLKPLHQTTEFCGTCHKVHLPEALNGYKWLRGQNHYDSFFLSGVSGQGIQSFYYPPKAETNCNGCHMELRPATDAPNFGARVRDDSGVPTVTDHLFPSANTAIPHLLPDQMPDAAAAIAAHRAFTEGTCRVDIFGLKPGGTIESSLLAPLRPEVPPVRPGQAYVIEIVLRTLKLGHLLTEGTADSNELWLDVTVTSGDRVLGRSGALDPESRAVDPWSHFVNAFVIDREGRRIDRRNAEDIFVALYNHQIPPGAADVLHYRFEVPDDLAEPVEVHAALRYRKFDTTYMRLVTDDPSYVNDLPIMTIAEDRVVLPVENRGHAPLNPDSTIEPWQRWNDYGIGLLRKGQFGELRQAAAAFEQVERLGRADGPLNLARTYIREGLVQTHAPEALARAATMTPPAPPWSLLWFGAQVAIRNGDYDRAITDLRRLVPADGRPFEPQRGFDFARNYRVRNELAAALYQRGLRERDDVRRATMEQARDQYLAALASDPENLAAHYGLKQVFRDLGDAEREAHHAAEHARYKPDDNARDYAVAQARLRYPAANHAAEAVVIYDLQRTDTAGTATGPEDAEPDERTTDGSDARRTASR